MPRTTTVIVELDGFRNEMLDLFKTSLEAMAASFKGINCGEGHSGGSHDMDGIRQGIIANARLLAPFTTPRDASFSPVTACFEIDPEMLVVTSGSTPSITARIYSGTANGAKELLAATASPTTIGALQNLLKLTQELIHAKLPTLNNSAPPPPVAKSPRVGSNHYRMSTLDRALWDSETVTNTTFQAEGSFDFGRCDGYSSDNDSYSPTDSAYGSDYGFDWHYLNYTPPRSFGSDDATVAADDGFGHF